MKIDPGEDDVLSIAFDIPVEGLLLLGGKRYLVDDGRASIPKNAIASGEYHPRLECAEGVFRLEGFTKRGRDITMENDVKNLARQLAARLRQLEKQSLLLDDRITHLEGICEGNAILNFERKEK